VSRIELLQGTLDMLVLNALKLEANHGLGISRRIHQITRGTFDVRPGRSTRRCTGWKKEDG
jgi:DNA-binding PadR family transcriptional regulator